MFSIPAMPQITGGEANPLAGAIPQAAQLQQALINNYLNSVKAQYAQPQAEQDLQKAILANQQSQQNLDWNPKRWQSDIGLQNAQAGLANQQAKFYPKVTQSEIDLRKAQTNEAAAHAGSLGVEAQINQMKLDKLKEYLKQNYSNVSLPSSASSGQTNADQMASTQTDSEQPSAQQPSNTIYGIDNPNPTQSDMLNQMLFGMDTFSPRLQNAKTQQQDQYNQYQKSISEAVQEANSAAKLKQTLEIFNRAMDNSYYKGQTLGGLPSSGFLTSVLLAGHDLSNEQIADKQISQMLPGAITELRDAMGSARFSNMDMLAAGNMKFSRSMNDTTRKVQSDFINGLYNRMEEKAKFYSLMGNPQGPQKQVADMAWQSYQENFPLSGTDDKGQLKFNSENLNNWPLYTTPKALDSIRRTGSYTPTQKEKNTFYMKVPDGNGGFVVLPVKKGQIESMFRKGALPL